MKNAFSKWLRENLRNWLGNLASGLGSLLIFFGISVILCLGLLYILKYLWVIYIATPAGEHFAENFPSHADAIEGVLRYKPYLLSLYVNVAAVKICLAGGLVGTLLSLVRYLHEYRGFLGRIIFWGLPFTFFTAYIIRPHYDLDWIPALSLSVIPSLILMSPCIRLISELFPEIKTVLGSIISLAQRGREPSGEDEPPDDDLSPNEEQSPVK